MFFLRPEHIFSWIHSRSSLKSLKSTTSKPEKDLFTKLWQSSAEICHNALFDSTGLNEHLEVLAPCDQLLLGDLPTIIGDISIWQNSWGDVR